MSHNNSDSDRKTISRRKFLGTTTSGIVALTIIPRHVMGGNGFVAPNDKINLGFIGTGKQARGLGSNFAKKANAQIIAASDVDTRKLNRFKDLIEGIYTKDAANQYKGLKTYGKYREMLQMKEIDAVVIATPDHWHAINVIDAAKAGKDIYCEKPLSHSIEEGRVMANAVTKYNRILQTGSMQRSDKRFRKACELVRNGLIGDIKEVKVAVGEPPITCDLPTQPVPEYLDWENWVGPAAYRDFNAVLSPPVEEDIFPNWRKYKEYGGGFTADWGAHMFDIAQWALGMDHSGPVEIYPADTCKHKNLTLVYANGIEMTHEVFGRGWAVRFIGTKGIIDISRSFLDTIPANLADYEFKPTDVRLYESNNHLDDWLDCIKTRKQPICPTEVGHRTASVCHLTNISYELKRPLKWDPKKEEFLNDEEANKLRSCFIRKPYSLSI